MAQIQRQSQPHTFARDDPDDSFSLELELQKLRSIQRHVPPVSATNGHGHSQPSLYSDRNRGNGNTAMGNATILSDLYNSAGTDTQEQARRIRNQMILAKIQEIERNFTSVGLERQRKLDIMRREHEALIRKYRPMELLYKHVGISSTYPAGRSPGQNVPELKSTGVNTIITGPIVPASDSEKRSAGRSQQHLHDLESKHSSIGRRITFGDNARDNRSSIDNINLDEHQNNINTNPNNNNNNDDWTNDGNTTDDLRQTFAIRDQFNDLESRFRSRQQQLLQPAEENEIKRDQNNAADKLVDKQNKSMDVDEARPTQQQHGYFLDTSATESEDNANEFPATRLLSHEHQATSNANTTGPQAVRPNDDDETSETTSFSGPREKDRKRKDFEMKANNAAAAAAVVNLSSDSSFTTFPTTHTNTTTSHDLLANAKGGKNKREVNLLGADYGNAGDVDVADVGGATSLEILDGPGTETVNDADAEVEADADPDEVLRKQVPGGEGATGKEADDNEDGEDNTQTSAAGESIVMDSVQNIKTATADSPVPRDESELVNIAEIRDDDEGDQHGGIETEEENQVHELELEVKNRVRNVEVINEDRNNRIQDTEDDVALELDESDGEDAGEKNKDVEIHTVFTKEFLPTTASVSDMDVADLDADTGGPIQADNTGFGERMDEKMNPDERNDFPIEKKKNTYRSIMFDPDRMRQEDSSSPEEMNSQMNEVGDRETTSTNEMKLKDDDFSSNESDVHGKEKETADEGATTSVPGTTTEKSSADSKGKRFRLKLNPEDSEESELSEPVAKANASYSKAGDQNTEDEEGMKDVHVGAPYIPYNTQSLAIISDADKFITAEDIAAEMNESDNDSFYDRV